MDAMGQAHNNMVLEVMSKPENVAFVRQVVAMFAAQLDFTMDDIDEIKVAVSEVASNAVIHGYGHSDGILRIEAHHDSSGLSITISDTGVGIDDVDWAMQATHTSQPEERMGLGLVFVREYMDDMVVSSSPGQGTTIRMVKYVRTQSIPH